MKTIKLSSWMKTALTVALGMSALVPGAKSASAATRFEQSVYLYTQAYDTDLSGSAGSGTGNWGTYRNWLGVANLGAESDPGWSSWWDCCQHVSWNSPWAAQQQRKGANLPTVILGMGQMPFDPNTNDTWAQKLAWENQQWQLEANNDPTIMGYFANYAREVNSLGFKKVVIRLGYEFDGGWNPFGNLNSMSNMPNNYIAAWRNIVNTMRANDSGGIIKFCWNPTDSNVQVTTANYYPGDAYVDYIGFDTYDYAYGGVYPVGTAQPTQAQRDAAWNNSELPRINALANMGRAHGKPLIIGEWGLWQLNDASHPSGGDNTSYIQRMYNWMSDPYNNVAIECYFEAPADGNSSLSGIFGPTTFPNSATLYKQLFSDAGNPTTSNYLTNPSFESGNLNGWNLWVGSNGGAAYPGNGASEKHTGNWGYVNWSSSPYQLTLYQQVNVPNGAHTISAWIKSSGGQTACQMAARYYDASNPNNGYYVNIPATSTWQKFTIPVNVTSGTVEVSFYSLASANQWINVDDVVVN